MRPQHNQPMSIQWRGIPRPAFGMGDVESEYRGQQRGDQDQTHGESLNECPTKSYERVFDGSYLAAYRNGRRNMPPK